MELKEPMSFERQKNNSLFAYTLVLLKRLPEVQMKKAMIDDLNMVIEEYKDDIDFALIGFPENYENVLKNNAK